MKNEDWIYISYAYHSHNTKYVQITIALISYKPIIKDLLPQIYKTDQLTQTLLVQIFYFDAYNFQKYISLKYSLL